MKERIEKRIKELEEQKINLSNSFNACEGAILVLKELLVEEVKETKDSK